jgi:glucose/arabinose dehydrogenase
MKTIVAVCLFALTSVFTLAQEPDGLKLPQGFHATVVTEGLGPIRHLAVGADGDIYVSTPAPRQGTGGGIIALHLDAQHKADQVQHFSSVDGGTAIRFYKGDLYAASSTTIYRFHFQSGNLLPEGTPEVIVDGMPAKGNRALAFDKDGHLYVSLAGTGNNCADPKAPAGSAPVGLNPCPDLKDGAGIWRFDATKQNQKFPSEGVLFATGVRNSTALDWSPADNHLYVILQGRDQAHKGWPQMISEQEDDQVADEMHRVTIGSDFGWPYTYYDGVRKLRLIAPEYGGDGKKTAPDGKYSTPVLTFQSMRVSPIDLMFYSGKSFPASYRDGAFIALHGTHNKSGYDVVFVPFDHSGVAGSPQVFADGFADFGASTSMQARYRPVGLAAGPDGSLYIADSQKGRIWRISYDGK